MRTPFFLTSKKVSDPLRLQLRCASKSLTSLSPRGFEREVRLLEASECVCFLGVFYILIFGKWLVSILILILINFFFSFGYLDFEFCFLGNWRSVFVF